jgi:hypothetical protein
LGPAATVNFRVSTTPKNLGGVIAGTFPNSKLHTMYDWLLCIAGILALLLAARTRQIARAGAALACGRMQRQATHTRPQRHPTGNLQFHPDRRR